MFAEDEAALLLEAATNAADLEDLLVRRVAGLPLEQVLGWAEFGGLRILLEPDVFVPRRRTELLVREAAARAPLDRPHGKGPVVLDLCCGSAAVGTALAAALVDVELFAGDIHPAAVRCARRNVAAAGGRVFEGDLFEPLPPELRRRVDLLVVNAPYVPTDAIALMPPEARLHEPLVSLDGGSDGLDVQRRVVAGAGDWLAPGGALLIETSLGQAGRTAQMMRSHGLHPQVVHDDDLDGTVVIGTSPA